MGPGVPLRGAALSEENGSRRSGPSRAVSIIRDQRVYLPSLRDQSERPDRSGGVVLQPAGWSGELDQGSQQRRGPGGTSFQTVRRQRQSLPVGDAGLQPELLADAVQPGGQCGRRNTTSYDVGYGAAAIPVRGRQDLASCGKDRSELQRSLPRARCTAADDGPAPRDCHARVSFRTCRGSGADLKTAVHKILCTIRNCKQEDNIAARSY